MTAWREPLSVRTGRALNRHRTLVYSAAAALIVSVIGLAGSAVLLAGKNREIDTQRLQALDERNRAERARDVAFSSLRAIVSPGKDEMATEEARPFREMLLDEGLRLSRDMIQGAEGDARAVKVRSLALLLQAEILTAKGDRGKALDAWKQAVDLYEALVARDPTDINNRESLANLYGLYTKVDNSIEAVRANLLRANEIYTGLLRENPQSTKADGWVWFIATHLHNLGTRYFAKSMSTSDGNSSELLERAIQSFREGLRFCEERVSQTGRRDGLLRAFAVNEVYLFRAYRVRARALKDPRESAEIFNQAIEWGKKAIADSRALLNQDTHDYVRGRELYLAQHEVGLHYLDAGPTEAAIPYFKEARETLKAMVATHGKVVSRVAEIKELLAVVDHNLTMAYDQADAARYYTGPRRDVVREAYEICDKLGLVKPLSPNLRWIYASSCLETADYEEEDGEKPNPDLLLNSERLFNAKLKENPDHQEARGMLVITRLRLADALTARGRIDEGARWRTLAPSTARGNPELFYAIATTFSSSAELVGKYPTKLKPQQLEARRSRLQKRAISMLHEASVDGLTDWRRVRDERSFDPLRSDPEFQTVVLDIQFPRSPIAGTK